MGTRSACHPVAAGWRRVRAGLDRDGCGNRQSRPGTFVFASLPAIPDRALALAAGLDVALAAGQLTGFFVNG